MGLVGNPADFILPQLIDPGSLEALREDLLWYEAGSGIPHGLYHETAGVNPVRFPYSGSILMIVYPENQG